MFCNQCGTELPKDAKFCHSCGTSTGYTKPDHNFISSDAPAQLKQVRKFSFTDMNAGGLFVILLSLSALLFFGYIKVFTTMEQRRLHPPGVCDSANPGACYANSVDIGSFLNQHRGEHDQIMEGRWKNVNPGAVIRLITFDSDGKLSGYKSDEFYTGNFRGEYATYDENHLTMTMNTDIGLFTFSCDGSTLTVRKDNSSDEDKFDRINE